MEIRLEMISVLLESTTDNVFSSHVIRTCKSKKGLHYKPNIRKSTDTNMTEPSLLHPRIVTSSNGADAATTNFEMSSHNKLANMRMDVEKLKGAQGNYLSRFLYIKTSRDDDTGIWL